MIRTATIACAALALAACGGAEPEEDTSLDTTVEEGEVALADEISSVADSPYAGTSWEWTANDGTLVATSFGEDGAFQHVGGNELRGQGTWSYDETASKVCVEPLTGEADCWSLPPELPQMGDSLVTQTDSGESIELTRTEYTPQAVASPDAAF